MLEMEAVEVYPLIALLLFGSFFLGWLIYTIRLPKAEADQFSQIPFQSENDIKETNHE